MKEFGPSYYDQLSKQKKIRFSVFEIPHIVFNAREAFKQRKAVDLEEANNWLNISWSALKITQPDIFDNDQPPHIEKHLASGFMSNVFIFETSKGKWVIKIGSKMFPSNGYFNPSTKEFCQSYTRGLNILRDTFRKSLPYLIPEPQEVVYLNSRDQSTTVIVQPYIRNARDFREISKLSPAESAILGTELSTFDVSCRLMRKKYGLLPDLPSFGRKGNLAIAPINDTYHLVLLDNGLIDLNAPSPVLNLVNLCAYLFLLKTEKVKLKQKIRKVD